MTTTYNPITGDYFETTTSSNSDTVNVTIEDVLENYVTNYTFTSPPPPDQVGIATPVIPQAAVKKKRKRAKMKKTKQFKNAIPEPSFVDGMKVINLHRQLLENIPAANRLLETSIFPRLGKGQGIVLRFRQSVTTVKRDRLHIFMKELVDFAAANKAKILLLTSSATLQQNLINLFPNKPFEIRITSIFKTELKAEKAKLF